MDGREVKPRRRRDERRVAPTNAESPLTTAAYQRLIIRRLR
jgi:hypothetical protein